MEKEDGVWRTIRGRRIFIASGQSLGEAMKKSGKFKREDIRPARQKTSEIDRLDKSIKRGDGEKQRHKWQSKFVKEKDVNANNQAPKNRINEKGDGLLGAKTRIENNYFRYSDTDKREIRHENLQKKLKEYKDKTMHKHGWTISEAEAIRRGELGYNERKFDANRKEQSIRDIEKFKAKKQSNNKVNDNDIVNDDNQAISYSFRTNKRDMFTIRYNRTGNNKNMDFATTASTFNRKRTDYERAGQAQKDVLKEGTKARAFYDKWDKKHLGTLTQKEYKELVNDIEDLKKEYPYIQGNRFYDQVELDRSTKDKKSKIEAYKKRKGK